MTRPIFRFGSYEKYLNSLRLVRRRTARRRAQRGTLWRHVLARIGCGVCGLKDARFLEWNHKNPTEKLFHITRSYDFPIRTILPEIRKCEVLCSACHKEETLRQRKSGELVNSPQTRLTREAWEAGRAAYVKTLVRPARGPYKTRNKKD